MIDINKFEKVAKEIIANSTKDEMQNWLESYRTSKAISVKCKPSIKTNYNKKDVVTSLESSENNSEISFTTK